MNRERRGTWANIDPWLVAIYFALVVAGFFNIYSAEFSEGSQSLLSFSTSHGKQFIWIIAATVFALVILLIDSRVYSTFSYVFYGASIFLLLLTLLIGTEIAGARSWIRIGSFSIQPAEFAKVATALAVSKYLNTYGVSISLLKDRLIAFALVAVPMLLVLAQNDTGSALVFAAFFLVFYRFGLPTYFLAISLIAAVLFILTLLLPKLLIILFIVTLGVFAFWIIGVHWRSGITVLTVCLLAAAFVYTTDYAFQEVLKPHQQERIEVILGKKVDLKGAGYNIHQSLIAIGSGGWNGKGFLNGTQTKFNFVPEQTTDFIFCTVGEEWGFLGSGLIVLLFAALILRLIYNAEKQKTKFSKIYLYCIASIFTLHYMINIGMTLGIFPVIGIPLPFLSYGGSSLWAFTILLFMGLKLDASRKEFLS